MNLIEPIEPPKFSENLVQAVSNNDPALNSKLKTSILTGQKFLPCCTRILLKDLFENPGILPDSAKTSNFT